MKEKYRQFYTQLLKTELMPAMGCTEPIAIAYASAICAYELGNPPESISIACSPNIIKNVKSVIVPNSDGMKGIPAAAALGAFGGDHTKKLEVLSVVSEDKRQLARKFVEAGKCNVEVLPGDATLHLIVTMKHGGDTASVELADTHTNIVSVIKNGEPVFTKYREASDEKTELPFPMTIATILEYANTVPLDEIAEVVDRQIELNSAISKEGQTNRWGAQIGRILLRTEPDSVETRAKAAAAAASDARMSGCDKAVIINSGSGNQGVTASMPVIEYANHLGADKEKLYRALLVSNLVALYQKFFIGKLSAFCGVVCAACGSGAAITYLKGGDEEVIGKAIRNTLAIASGMVCDGAKPSCAAKIAVAVEGALLGHNMAMEGLEFSGGDGIVKDDADATIHAIGRLASKGMKSTDQEILDIMLDK